jgi:3-oxoacyl-[acyl-carrier-protein] synthase II
MVMALEDADVTPDQIAHLNAHATSTPSGDVAEAAAIRTALGDAADGVAVSATKSITGHLLGAAGAVESILTVLALHERTAPPTINLDDPTTTWTSTSWAASRGRCPTARSPR